MPLVGRNGGVKCNHPVSVALPTWRHSTHVFLFLLFLWTTDYLGVSPAHRTCQGEQATYATPWVQQERFFLENLTRSANNPYSPQCLVVDYSHTITEFCDLPQKRRTVEMNEGHRLKFCEKYHLETTINPKICKINSSPTECRDCLHSIEVLDQKAYNLYYAFEDIFNKVDCTANFSVQWNCTDCKVSYEDYW